MHSCVTEHVIWNGIRNGLSMEDAEYLFDLEHRIVKEREIYFDSLYDNEIDTYNDILSLMNVCLNEGKETAGTLAEAYFEGIKVYVGGNYTLSDIMMKKVKQIKEKQYDYNYLRKNDK